jgi:hypothetical protein
MDVRVEAGVCMAVSAMQEINITVENVNSITFKSPVISRFSLTPILSIGGTSISSITPTKSLIGVMA